MRCPQCGCIFCPDAVRLSPGCAPQIYCTTRCTNAAHRYRQRQNITCAAKIPYPSAESAGGAVSAQRRLRGDSLRVYQCPADPGHWHLTSLQEGESQPGASRRRNGNSRVARGERSGS